MEIQRENTTGMRPGLESRETKGGIERQSAIRVENQINIGVDNDTGIGIDIEKGSAVRGRAAAGGGAGCAHYLPLYKGTPSQNSFGMQPPPRARMDAGHFKIPAFFRNFPGGLVEC
ncbi:hypothetical protein EVAR_19997_1 [Eumeta japonica]|uniref:Uncharacterized protein n=1 Tax=Eumeta variegata TaxID=151549 RepID=A0A4C1VB26_EUMVA|nr:hypothetical protein EVAR_19997_1 [Eumeta japonica]